MSLSRWWREWQFEQSYKKSIRADLARIGKEYQAKFKVLATGNDFDAAMAAYLKACRLPDPGCKRYGAADCGAKPTRAASSSPGIGGNTMRNTTCGSSRPTAGARRNGASRRNACGPSAWLQVLTPAVALIVGLAGVVIGLLSMWRWP